MRPRPPYNPDPYADEALITAMERVTEEDVLGYISEMDAASARHVIGEAAWDRLIQTIAEERLDDAWAG